MVGIGSAFHLWLPGKSKQRVLHPAKVVSVKPMENSYLGDVEELNLAAEIGQDFIVYFENNSRFMQQPARIDGLYKAESQLIISFTTTGEPASAESRQHYRVSTVFVRGLTAEMGTKRVCLVVDVGVTGFGVIAKEHYSIGNQVDASIEYEGQKYTGNVCIQSVRELGEGRIRYGLQCASAKTSQGNLTKGLQNMSVKIQREQLRRLAQFR